MERESIWESVGIEAMERRNGWDRVGILRVETLYWSETPEV